MKNVYTKIIKERGLIGKLSHSYLDVPLLAINKTIQPKKDVTPPSFGEEDQDAVEGRLKDLGISKRYSKQNLWLLFTTTAFPIHVWAIILILQDVSWVAERTNAWDAVGVGSYGLMIAFVESLSVFLVLLLLGLLISKKWKEVQQVSLLAYIVLIVSFWEIIGQLYFLLEWLFPHQFIEFVAGISRPLWVLYGSAFLVVAPTIVIPAFIALRTNKFAAVMTAIMERLSMLVVLYLILDVAGIIVVIIRNLQV